MILPHINHKMPIYKDCTLGELLTIGTLVFLSLSMTLSLLTKCLLGFAWIGFSIAILALVHVTRFLCGKLQKIKYGKPYGYYQQLFMKKTQNTFLKTIIKMPFVTRRSKWSVRRKL